MSAESEQPHIPHIHEITSRPDSRPEKPSPLQALAERYPALRRHTAEFPHSTLSDCIVFLIMVDNCPIGSIAACSGLTKEEVDSLFLESFGGSVESEGTTLEVRQNASATETQFPLPNISSITKELIGREKRRQTLYPTEVPERKSKRRPYSRRTTTPNEQAS